MRVLPVLVAVAAILVPRAEATPPGENGEIAFEREGLVHVIEPDGLLACPLVEGSSPAWSPDGERIAFVRGRGTESPEVWTADANGMGERRLGSGTWPAWSPDGRFLAVVGDEGILVLSAEDGTVVRELILGGRPDWAPDCSRVAFVGSGGGGYTDIYVVRPDGADRRRITDHPSSDRLPSWSPDSGRMAFWLAGRHLLPPQDIWTMARDGTDRRKVVEGGMEPAWSPDGERIAYVDLQGELWTVSPDGSDARHVVDGARHPDWRPIPTSGEEVPTCRVTGEDAHGTSPQPGESEGAGAAPGSTTTPTTAPEADGRDGSRPDTASALETERPTPSPSRTPASQSGQASGPRSERTGFPLVLVAGAVAGVIAVAAASWLFSRRGGGEA